MSRGAVHILGFRAFTLIELIAVMLLIAIMAAIVAPSLSGFAAGRRLNDTAVSMLALMDMGRASAAGEGRVYRFNLDPVKRQFWLTAQEGGVFTELGTDIGRKLEIPEDLVVEWTEPAGQAEIGYVQITPVGEVDPATIRIVGSEFHELRLTAASPTEKYRILTADEIASDTSTVESAAKPGATNTNSASSKSNSKNTGSSSGFGGSGMGGSSGGGASRSSSSRSSGGGF